MIPLFLDSNFKEVDVLDVYNSFIWTDRYNFCGDFEFSVSPVEKIFSILSASKYLKLEESEHLMFIEDVNIRTDSEKGNELIVKGRSLESMLDRRIAWDISDLYGDFQTAGIFELLYNNITNSGFDRIIANFIYSESTDPDIMAATIGDKITRPGTQFIFELYNGVDRSFNQTTNPYVVFSPNFDNLKSGEYIKTDRFLKNFALVVGEKGVGNVELTTTATTNEDATDLDRREICIKNNDVKRRDPGTPLSDADYLLRLERAGEIELAKHKTIEAFEGEIDDSTFYYGVDFGMGDILQVEDEYGNSAGSRVVEVIYSKDTSGSKMIPIFAAV